jgi:hypothetical protein
MSFNRLLDYKIHTIAIKCQMYAYDKREVSAVRAAFKEHQHKNIIFHTAYLLV